jgi:predicted cupin superfamily sugar epimerase
MVKRKLTDARRARRGAGAAANARAPRRRALRRRSARDWIARLRLARHPEGGWFRETYRAAESIPRSALPARFPGDRAFATAIYFLLEEGDISALHRIRSDEIWHFYAGDPLTLVVLDAAGRLMTHRLGPGSGRGEAFQAVVPAGSWFGAALADGAAGPRPRGGRHADPGAHRRRYALVGCTVAPGFDFADFELADAVALARRHPRHRRLIERLARGGG